MTSKNIPKTKDLPKLKGYVIDNSIVIDSKVKERSNDVWDKEIYLEKDPPEYTTISFGLSKELVIPLKIASTLLNIQRGALLNEAVQSYLANIFRLDFFNLADFTKLDAQCKEKFSDLYEK